MSRGIAALVLGTLALAGCPKPPTTPTPPAALTANDRAAIARLEAQREAGVARLVELAADAHPERRALALRALGRVGSPAAVTFLRGRLTGDDAIAAAAALGVAAATGALEPAEAKAIAGELAAVTASGPARAVVLEALGRTGDVAALAPLASALGSDDPAIAAAAGIGLGRLGRAKVLLDGTTELTAIGRTKADDAEVRYAATYALARAFVDPTSSPPAATDPVVRALSARLTDAEPTIRALAVFGLGARKAVPVTMPALAEVQRDSDWRVGVELVRALGGSSANEASKAALVAYVGKVAREWSAGTLAPPFAHVVLEALRQNLERAAEPVLRPMYLTIARELVDRPATGRPADRQRAAAWMGCLALAGAAHPAPAGGSTDALADPAVAASQLRACGRDLVPANEVTALWLDAVAAGPAPAALATILPYAKNTPADVAARAIASLPVLWDKGGPVEHKQIASAVASAIAAAEPMLAGTAVEAATTLFAAAGASDELAPVATALVARLGRSTDELELTIALLDVVGAAKLDAAPTCQALRTHVNPALRAAARACVTALFGEDLGRAPPVGAAPTPPVDPIKAFDGVHRWRLLTSQGEVVIELSPALAPWHVASVAKLTRDGFYDGLPFHRVVPDFVVQGGDPTGTGWGGPAYTLPAEPGSALDGGVGYRPGGVGIADAGKDTSGSQWFAMTGRAPHLEGRYTWIGTVTEGADVLDRLQIGDTVVRARIE